MESETAMTNLGAAIRNHPAFASLPQRALEELLDHAAAEIFAGGEMLVRQDEPSDSVILLMEGQVEILVRTAAGPVRLAALWGPALLGEIGALADLPRTATVRASGPGRLLRIGKAPFNRLADAHPAILRHVVAHLGGQIRAFNAAIGVYTDALAALEREDYDEAMLEHLNNPSPELANFAATFRKMAQQIVIRRRHRDEMADAAAIQRAMLPQPLPQDRLGRADLFAAMRPAREVGGDFYDAFFVDADRLAFTVGDVSGKGVPASLFMAVCQTTLRMALREEAHDIGGALERANALLEAENGAGMFATFFGAVIDLSDGHVRYCNCGHNPPLILRGDGRVEVLPMGGIALGIMSPASYRTRELRLDAGERMVLFTDGLTEAHDAEGELFEDERLKHAFARHHEKDAKAMVEAVFAEIAAFSAGAPQHDDLTCLALAYAGPGRG